MCSFVDGYTFCAFNVGRRSLCVVGYSVGFSCVFDSLFAVSLVITSLLCVVSLWELEMVSPVLVCGLCLWSVLLKSVHMFFGIPYLRHLLGMSLVAWFIRVVLYIHNAVYEHFYSSCVFFQRGLIVPIVLSATLFGGGILCLSCDIPS